MERLFTPMPKKIPLIHIGVGKVGSTLVNQVIKERNQILKMFQIDLQFVGLFRSDTCIVKKSGLTSEEVKQFLKGTKKNTRTPDDVKKLISTIKGPCICIDTTSSTATIETYLQVLNKNGYIVSANKKPFSDSYTQFSLLTKTHQKKVFFETTVGAGLPVISTIQDLVQTGDTISTISGCFSGTLGYLFSNLETGKQFSTIVRQAKKLGYTEPDPRDDLSGIDVARKLLILSRLIGRTYELSDIQLTPLYPDTLQDLSVDQFLSEISTLDRAYEKQMDTAVKNNRSYRYIASLSADGCSVKMDQVAKNSDIGSLNGTDNIIQIVSKRYQNPLIIKGPGAGLEVTAMGLFSDILKVVRIHS